MSNEPTNQKAKDPDEDTGIMRTLAHPDPVIQEVLDIWTARFLAGGIGIGDLNRTLSRISAWGDWGPEWTKTAAEHEARADHAEEAGQIQSATEAYLTASKYYHLAYFLSVDDVDLHHHGLNKMVACHDRVLDRQRPAVEKVAIPYLDGPLLGLLSTPPGPGPAPVVIVLPGLDSTKETRHAGRAALLNRGLAVLSFDGPGQGEVSKRLPIRPDYEVAIAAAVDWIETRPELDASRVGVNGASLGGYYACRAAAFEPRVKAVVANCGPYDWGECWDQLPVVTRGAFRMYSHSRTDEEAREKANDLNLHGVADKIETPIMVIFGKNDPLIPWEHGQRVIDEARGEKVFLAIDGAGHSVNDFPYLVRPQANDWLAEHLGGRVD